MRRVRASASIFSSAWKFSTRIRRTTSRARASSRTSASRRPTSRLTTASAIRPAISSPRAMSEGTGYTPAKEGVKYNYMENRSKVPVERGQQQPESRSFSRQAVHLDTPAMSLRQCLDEAQAEAQTTGGRGLRVGNPHVPVEDAGELLGGDPHAVVLD